jgi:hypothetical protein
MNGVICWTKYFENEFIRLNFDHEKQMILKLEPMKTEFNRRDFISTCLKAGATCCALSYSLTGFGQDSVMELQKKYKEG